MPNKGLTSGSGSGINEQEFLARYQALDELILEMTAMFPTVSADLMQKIKTAIDDGSSRELEIAAHTLKSVFANFCAARAVEGAEILERCGRDADLRNAHKQLEVLHAEIAAIQTGIKSIQRKKAV